MIRPWSVLMLVGLLLSTSDLARAGTIHVDQAALCGLGDGSAATPFCTIQEGIFVARLGDVVLVAPGTYLETIDYLGKGIAVVSSGGHAVTVIDGNGVGPVVSFDDFEGTDSILEGFTVTGGVATVGAGINCSGSEPTLRNLAIIGNQASFAGGAINFNGFSSVFPPLLPTIENCLIARNACQGSGPGGINLSNRVNATITNTTITENLGTDPPGPFNDGSGGLLVGSSFPVITNCILWNNFPNEIAINSTLPIGEPDISYSNVRNGWIGVGNIDVDPLFVDPSNDDFHLSQPSPCVDTGTNTPLGGLAATDLEGDDRVLDGDGDSLAVVDMGADEVDPAECFLVIGPAPGSALFAPGMHAWTAQLGSVTSSWPVTVGDIPLIELTGAAPTLFGTALGGTDGGLGQPLTLYAQVLMWNPSVFPGNPEQWSNGLFVQVHSPGTWFAAPYGTTNGMQLTVSTVHKRDGSVALQFAFTIDGL